MPSFLRIHEERERKSESTKARERESERTRKRVRAKERGERTHNRSFGPDTCGHDTTVRLRVKNWNWNTTVDNLCRLGFDTKSESKRARERERNRARDSEIERKIEHIIQR